MRSFFHSIDSAQRWVLQPLLVLAILAGGFIGSRKIATLKSKPRPSANVTYAPLVRAVEVKGGTHRVVVRGNGTLAARTRVGLVPQVMGEVVAIHPALRAGGLFRAGEVLFAIEPRDYELNVAKAEADVATAETVVQDIAARAESALAEWRALHADRPPPPLVALEPQVAEAKARRAAAVAALDSAKLSLERTRVVARFDGRVVSASIDVGQVVSVGARVGEVYALDVLEVAVPMTLDDLRWISIEGEARAGLPTDVSLEVRIDDRDVTFKGRVARLEAELARDTRLAKVVVELDIADAPPELSLRLVPGLFVQAAFAGQTLEDIGVIPRAALREGGAVWVVAEDALVFRYPEVLLSEDDSLVIRGLPDGARVVTSDLDVVTNGMHVRLATEAAQQ
ncbi:MAG: efflux RND transporter periplasmic adaptor subunit [Planctomycetota bacterium]